MRLRLFRAAGMADAMAQVRAELGGDALILNSRKVGDRIEITAALEPEPRPIDTDPRRLAALAWHGVPQKFHPVLASGDLETAVAEILAFSVLPLLSDGCPVMLTGPPGAGKTLTIVRLATRLILSGTAPLVITTDTRRAGAIEQLGAFTRLLGIPLLVASRPASLARALTQRRNGAPVLIDSVGMDPTDPHQIEELQSLAAVADAHVTLVLPTGLDPAEAAEFAAAYAEHGATSLIATRLDISRRLGGIIAAAALSLLPLTDAGIGSGAMDGLVPLTSSLLATKLSRIEGRHNDN